MVTICFLFLFLSHSFQSFWSWLKSSSPLEDFFAPSLLVILSIYIHFLSVFSSFSSLCSEILKHQFGHDFLIYEHSLLPHSRTKGKSQNWPIFTTYATIIILFFFTYFVLVSKTLEWQLCSNLQTLFHNFSVVFFPQRMP